MTVLPSLDAGGKEAVERLISAINSKIAIREFLFELSKFFKRDRGQGEITLTRLRAGPLKKIMDEVVVISRFLKWSRKRNGYVRFPMDNFAPDCWWWPEGAASKIGIEVTVARGTERYFLSQEMVQTGHGRGFLRVQDDADQNQYKEALKK